MTLAPQNGSYQVWKNATMFLAGVVLSLCVMWATYVRSAVTRDEMESYVNSRLGTLDNQIAELNKNVIELQKTTAALTGELEALRGKK